LSSGGRHDHHHHSAIAGAELAPVDEALFSRDKQAALAGERVSPGLTPS